MMEGIGPGEGGGGGGGIGLGLVLEHAHPHSLLLKAGEQQQASDSSRGSERQLEMELKATPKYKARVLAMSDEDEPSFTEECGNGQKGEGKNKKGLPWQQRMKWTDSMVKLLIGVVLMVGEDNCSCLEGLDGNKRKVGILQKKGKWKSVSQLMMEKGCYVSPQQCEDKFNDLNKRYKRLNDVLGKENSAAVVCDPGLLASMDHLSPKLMDDAKKILSSRHLFYKEMRAYHQGDRAALAKDLDFHNPSRSLRPRDREMVDSVRMKYDNSEDDEDEDVEEEDGIDDDENDDDAYLELDLLRRSPAQVSGLSMKRRKVLQQRALHQLDDADMAMVDAHADEDHVRDMDVGDTVLIKGAQETCRLPRGHPHWLKSRTMQLKEQKMGLQAEAFNLERQRFKWQKVTSNKDREIERMRLENERMKLENDRIALQIKQREIEMDTKKSEASMASIALLLEKLKATDTKDPGAT